MTGKHYQWHKRWTVDLQAASATHESGLVVVFAPHPEGGWDGRALNPNEVFETLTKTHGAGNAQQMLTRLAREAGDVWQRAQN